MNMMVQPYRFAAGGGGPSEPALFSTAFVYLDAEDLVGADNSAISGWPNKNDGANPWTDDNCTLQTAEINGLQAVEVPVASIGFGGPAAMLSGKTALTLVYVGDILTVTTGPCFTGWGTSGDSNHYPYTDNNIYLCFGSTIRRNVGDWDPMGIDDWHTCTIRAETNYWDFRTNGVQRLNSGTNTFAVNNNPRMGNGTPSKWAKILIWDSVLTDLEVADIEDYLQGLYATP